MCSNVVLTAIDGAKGIIHLIHQKVSFIHKQSPIILQMQIPISKFNYSDSYSNVTVVYSQSAPIYSDRQNCPNFFKFSHKFRFCQKIMARTLQS